MLQSIVHYSVHFIGPLLIALILFKQKWKKAYLIMLLGMLIDIDHLLVNPMFDANRCSINFHILHSYYAVGIYIMLSLLKPTRLIGIGLVIHILADIVDCSFILL